MGKKRLEDALQKIDHPVKVEYRSFELDPTMEREVDQNMYEKLAEKYGMSLEQAKSNCRNIERMAAEIGLDYQFDTLILTNTFDAHRLTMLAKSHGLMQDMTERILRAYFSESKHIGDHATLTELAVEVGLNHDEVAAMLASDDRSDEVRADQQEAVTLGIRSVPFFLINRKYSLTGAQPTDVFVQALQQVYSQDGPYKIDASEDSNVNTDKVVATGSDESLVCDENGCEIPKK
ncbi:DsbA family oxidoreductase [Schinkia azotoformans]|nr:DsbA family oxidoreductase [Schinkia azotoformans]MEC1639100.1 DsbA family oxidoreductase [Schinkia azotoformans]MEC1945129.1 DsbA family oxidoreductase [Schinkia azotoformans]